MDQDPSSKDKNQEPRTMVLKPLKDNQGFRIQGPRSTRKIKIRTPSQEQELEGLSTYNKNKNKNKTKTKNVVP